MKKWKGIDMFCGAGGSATGILESEVAEVKWAINHDEKAIESHAANHPEAEHYTQDIVDFDVTILPRKVDFIWISSECTHYSCAKGGDSRCEDSRTLPEQLFRYAKWTNPDMIFVENVKEFLTWGPLKQKTDKKGNPIFKNGKPAMVPDTDKDKLGIYYKRWVKKLMAMGYVNYRWKLLNAADYGAYTSRVRYFGVFAKKGVTIRFPKQTHVKGGAPGYEKWKAVKDVLDFEDKGKSIFGRKKPLTENSLARIYAGLEKFGAKGEGEMIVKNFSGRPWGKVNSVNCPLGAITTIDNKSLVHLMKYHGSKTTPISMDEPASTITTKDRLALVFPESFILKHYGNEKNAKSQVGSIKEPAGTITTNPKLALIETVSFLMKQYGTGENAKYNIGSVDKPAGSLTVNPKLALIEAEQNKSFIMRYYFGAKPTGIDETAPTIMAKRDQYLVQPSFLFNHNFDNKPKDVNQPCPTILASRKHWYLTQMETDSDFAEILKEKDRSDLNEKQKHYTILILAFMIIHGISDIKMRMLKVKELKCIQGFPENYILKGSDTEKKKFIGNSVHPLVAKVLLRSMWDANFQELNEVAA